MSTTTKSSFDESEGNEGFLDEKGFLNQQVNDLPLRKRARISWFWASIFTVSISLNAMWLILGLLKPTYIAHEKFVSKYAKLKFDKRLPFVEINQSLALTEDEWNDPLYNSDLGNVALSDEYVASLGLPPAQRWPWDFSKGIYFLQGHHQMHCLQMARQAINEYRTGALQSVHPIHVDHCLIAIREDIICNADDTPRFTGGHFKNPASGIGQLRACRDWGKMDEWVKKHSACYKNPEDAFDPASGLGRYMSCPDGSTPWVGAEIWTMENSEEKGGLWLEKGSR
ncbi:hypothetical protein HYFRA_00008953 [Hymenoscyphus fraxineus]|uniref:Uncharacterized protein n=1 Tax=Hymenoscyphus fraxineus TaxID=746836 RepID=A0A9N9KRR9_9HELO|nr:hypothetical protein HYFRA_00008953 [Hymenoscyphus fraxineus]